MSTFISEIIVFSYTFFTFNNTCSKWQPVYNFSYLFEFNYTCSNCLQLYFTIVLINCLFTFPKSVVFRKFHIQPTLSEAIKLPQDHLV